VADGIVILGGGWDQLPAGDTIGERALSVLLTCGGDVSGEPLIQRLKDLGYGDRGPAYYPRTDQNPAGPFYALGQPHNYAALNGDRTAWDLHVLDPNFVATPGAQPASCGGPTPPPGPLPPDTQQVFAEIAQAFVRIAELFQHWSDELA